MSEENAIRVIEDQPEAAAIEIPHEAGRDQASQRQMSLFGLSVDSGIVGILGPLSILALSLFMLAHARQVVRSKAEWSEVATSYPWICLTKDPLGLTLSFVTVVALPVLANAALLIRKPDFAFHGATIALVLCAGLTGLVSVLTFVEIGKLRHEVATRNPAIKAGV
jgi:hypothetical protein